MEKIEICCLFLLLCIALASGLVCWECEVVTSQEECLRRGSAVQCKPNQDQCHLTLRHGGWGDHPWIEKSCKTTKACSENHIQNVHPAWASQGEQVQCNEKYPSSVCRCCCGTNLCNQNRTSCLLSGNYGEWDYAQPRCRGVRCLPRLKTPKFGTMTKCSKGIRLNSRCRFSCEEGYRLTTPPVLQCIDDEDGDGQGLWSSPQPKCIPKQCPIQRPLRHGSISCTNENYVGSVCTFTCEASEGYFLVPEAPTQMTRLTCLRNESWDTLRPCCSLSCPEFAIMDLVIVLDSSSSVGATNWVLMLNFIDTFVRQFTIRNDSTHIAAIRYNGVVDKRNQITFNQFPESTDEVARSIMNLPYDGSGTNTGKALKYVNDVLLPLGNRKPATNVVLLLTDGASQDNVALPALRLRGNALVYVVPIQAQGGRVDLDQIRDIAGSSHPDRILKDALEGGFEALNAGFVDKITSRLCETPCFNPLHDHPDDTRDF